MSIAVFGAPGAGKSFGVKQVAKSLKDQRDCRDVEELTFNLSLYQKPEELAGAFHLVRDVALRGKVSLVFFDEFDTSLDGNPLGWLRHFLAPMQDGEFLDRGAPHPIGQSIFVFAGGTCATYREFASHPGMDDDGFKAIKGPDFLSRLRHALDIPSLNFLAACEPAMKAGEKIQPRGTFDPYGPIEEFPCEAAILLRRAAILEHNLREKAPKLIRADKSLGIAPEVLRALLRLPQFQHGNRSFEALLDMSHLAGASEFTPSLLPAPFQLPLHAEARHMDQLVATEFPLPLEDRLACAQAIHKHYQQQKRNDPNHDRKDGALKDWDDLDEDLKESNFGQADDLAIKLRSVGLWLRKNPAPIAATRTAAQATIEAHVEALAKAEHDRWSAQKRHQGWVAGPDTSQASRKNELLIHNCLFRWEQLTEDQKRLDREAVRSIPNLLPADYDIVHA